MFGSAPIWDVDVRTFGGKWRKNWSRDVKNWRHDVKKTTWRHARESSYTPSCQTVFPCPVQVQLNSGRVYKNISIVHGCEMRIETSVRGSLFGITRLYQVMPNSDPEWRIFLSAPNNHDGFSFLHTFWPPAFDFNVWVAIYKTRSFTLQWLQLPTS